MKIRILDIPPEGRELNFDLDLELLNERLTVGNGTPDTSAHAPKHNFSRPTRAEFFLDLEGSTIIAKGNVSGSLETCCSRCMEDIKIQVASPIQMVLKPETDRDREQLADEDVGFGFYNGKELDCEPLAEEALVLAIPYTALCRDDCRGLCSDCGKNLNREECKCDRAAQKSVGDPRFDILRSIKIH